jgi:hypothetical protein
MRNHPSSLPVRTRLPLAAWAVAGLVTLFSIASSLLHLAPVSFNGGLEQATHGKETKTSMLAALK